MGILLAAFAGIMIGGIINALADDLPLHRAPRLPRYPDGTPRPPIAWLGLGAFASGRRASPGGARLSWRYPAVELVTGVIFGYIAWAYRQDAEHLFYYFYMALFVLIAVTDFEHRIVPFAAVVPGALVALADALITGRPGIGDSLLGGVVGYGVFWVFYRGGALFLMAVSRRSPDGSEVKSPGGAEDGEEIAFGFGDVMLAALCGLIIGWQALIFAMLITVFSGAVGALAYIIGRMLSRGRYIAFAAIPYGPYIILGATVMLLWREPIKAFLQGLSG